MRLFFFLAIAGILLTTEPLFADVPTREIAVCAAKTSDVDRLACFDNIASKFGAEPKVTLPKVEDSGKWRVSTKTSPIDDSKNVYLRLIAEKPVSGKYGRESQPTLLIRCKENKTNLFIPFGFFLGSDSTRVTTRLDKEKARTSTWSISTDHEAIFAPRDISFTKKLMQHDRLLVQLTPYGESPVMTEFDVRGLENAVKPLREACNW